MDLPLLWSFSKHFSDVLLEPAFEQGSTNYAFLFCKRTCKLQTDHKDKRQRVERNLAKQLLDLSLRSCESEVFLASK